MQKSASLLQILSNSHCGKSKCDKRLCGIGRESDMWERYNLLEEELEEGVMCSKRKKVVPGFREKDFECHEHKESSMRDV